MATTRIIPMHINKGKTIAQCLSDWTEYAINPDKTEAGEFVSSFACDPKTADMEFLLSKRQYRQLTGRTQQSDVIVQTTWANEEWVMQAMAVQGFVKNTDGSFIMPEDRRVAMRIPTALIPRSPEDGRKVMPNLWSDDSFVEDAGWHQASAAYVDYLRQHQGQPRV